MKLFILAVIVGLTACATGEKFSSIEEGMSKEKVRTILGKQDQIEKRDDGSTVYMYKDRLLSGFSWDKTDYWVIFGSDNKVSSYGHGAIDTRTSERMTAMSVQAPAFQSGAQIRQEQRNNQNKDYECLSQCQDQGVMLGLCQKRCSF